MNRHRAVLTSVLIVLLATPALASWDDGVAAFRAGRYDDATSVFQTFVSSSPEAPQGHYMLGLSLLRQQRLADALVSLGEAVSLGGDNISYRMTFAQALIKAGKPGNAFDTLKVQDAAKVADASRATFNSLLANAATSSGRDAEALVSLDRALAADKRSKALWLARANLTGRLDRPEEAFSALATAFEIDPSDPEPGYKAAHSALTIAQGPAIGDRKGEWYAKAVVIADRLAASSPTPENLRLAGSANMGAKNYEGAFGYFERLLATDGKSPLLHFDLGRCQLALGQHDKALGYLDAALERSPDPELAASIHARRGTALQVLEKFTDAAAAFRQAGDNDAATKMEDYAQNRQEWAAAKDDCSKKLAGLEDLVAGSKDIEHTPEYKELQLELSSMRSACEPYFAEES